MAYHFGFFLLDALYEDFVVVIDDLHRIEADDLADSLLDWQVGEVAGNGKVLQFVVDEIDGLVADGSVQVFKYA
jgi:hypothetical protein